jgi:hypothetical protein
MRYENKVVKVDRENIDEVKSIIGVSDQRDEVEVGDIITTYPIKYGPDLKRCQVTIWWNSEKDAESDVIDVVKGRAAICTGETSVWGDYIERRKDALDRPYLITKDGDEVSLREEQGW